MKVFLCILLGFMYLNCTRFPEQEGFVFQTFGLEVFHDWDEKNVRKAIAMKWGISYRHVAGCGVSEEQTALIRQHNDSVVIRLEARHGPYWRERLQREFEAEQERQSRVRRLIDNHPYIGSYKTLLSLSDKHPQVLLAPNLPDSLLYRAVLFGQDERKRDTAFITYFKLKIDLATNQIIIVSDAPEPYTGLSETD